MRISTRTRYGARVLAELALAYPDRMLSVKELSKKQHISPKYLEHIMRALNTAGLVKSVRGANGGFYISRPPKEITLKMVFDALEGSIDIVHCVSNPESCLIHDICPTRDTWVQLKKHIESFLNKTTINDLAENKNLKTEKQNLTYQI